MWKAAANIIPNGETLNTFLLRLETRQGYLLSPLIVNIILEILGQHRTQDQCRKIYIFIYEQLTFGK